MKSRVLPVKTLARCLKRFRDPHHNSLLPPVRGHFSDSGAGPARRACTPVRRRPAPGIVACASNLSPVYQRLADALKHLEQVARSSDVKVREFLNERGREPQTAAPAACACILISWC